MASPIKFHADGGHRVSGDRVDAYGRVDVHLDGSWEGFAHTNSTGGFHIQGGGQRGTVVFYDAAGTNLYSKELWNFNINPGGDRQDNVSGGPENIPSAVVAAAVKMGFIVSDGESHPNIPVSLDDIIRAAQVVISVVGAA